MDCERCESLLVDFVSGSLAENEAAEFRVALESCEHCRLTLAKLERGRAFAKELPQFDPPPAMFAAVMRAAEARAAELGRERESVDVVEPMRAPARAPTQDAQGPLDGVWKWLASLLHGPQFAMAALLVLMVGVGLWWVPALSGPRSMPPPLVSDMPPALGPSASLEPVEPPRLEVDPRTGRVVPSVEGEERAAPDRPPRVALAEADETRHEIRSPEEERGGEAELSETDLAAAIGAVELSVGESVGVRTEDGPLPAMAPPSSAPATGLRADPSVPGTGLARGGLAERSGSSTGSSDTYARLSDRVAESPSIADDSVPAPGLDDSTLPASLHARARALARAASFADAARAYERLLSEHDDYAAAPRAMVELAEVYLRTGALSRARAWLDRAARYPSVATDVNRGRARLETMERAASVDMPMDSAEAGSSMPEASMAPPE